jgi:hypothetical protein
MALTEYEKKVLAELEYSLFTQDSQFGDSLSGKRIHAQGRRILRRGVTGFAVGSVCLVSFFTSSSTLSLIGLATMFVSSVVILSNVSSLRRVKGDPTSHPSVRIG